MKYYLIEYLLPDLAEKIFIKVTAADILVYAKDMGYMVSPESVDLVVQELAFAIMRNWWQIEFEFVAVKLDNEIDVSTLSEEKLNFASITLGCYAKEDIIQFLLTQLQIKPLSLIKVTSTVINSSICIMRRSYTFKSNEYLYTLGIRQMYIAIRAIVAGSVVTLYLNRLLVHSLYQEYYSAPGPDVRYELSPILQLSQLLELWLMEEYKLEIIVEQVKLVYLSKGDYLKIDCFSDEIFCGFMLLDSQADLTNLGFIQNKREAVTNNEMRDLVLHFPLNIGKCKLSVNEINNLIAGDVVMVDDYGLDKDNIYKLCLDLGNAGFIGKLENNNLKLIDL